MENQISICFDVEPMGEPLTISVKLNGKIEWQQLIDKSYSVEIPCSDDDGAKVLEIEMSGKTQEHTIVGDHGEIIKDSTVKISNFLIDEIEINQIIAQCAVYHHDFNGHGEPTQQKFYGEMGCNGTVRLEFTCPFYVWLLENM